MCVNIITVVNAMLCNSQLFGIVFTFGTDLGLQFGDGDGCTLYGLKSSWTTDHHTLSSLVLPETVPLVLEAYNWACVFKHFNIKMDRLYKSVKLYWRDVEHHFSGKYSLCGCFNDGGAGQRCITRRYKKNFSVGV